MSDSREPHWLPDFRRSLRYLRPHWRPLILGLTAAVGVSVFYTFSISAIIPLLKIMFGEHETIVDWLDRSESERRLGVVILPDLPDDPAGLTVARVRPESANVDSLANTARILSIGGDAPGSYELMRRIATHPDTNLDNVRIRGPDGEVKTTALALKPQRVWWSGVREAASWLPSGRTAADRLLALTIVMTGLVLVTLLSGLFRFANEGLVATAVQRTMHDIRSHTADHVLRLPIQWYSTHPPGDTLGRFSTDLNKVEVGIWTLFGKTVREPLKAVGVLVLTIAIDWHILVVAVIGIPVAALVIRVFGRLVKRAQKRASQSWGRLLDHLGERLTGIRVVKAYNMEDAESRRFEQEGRTLTGAQTHIALVDAATKPSLETLAMFAVAGFIIYGGSRVFQQEIEPHLFFAAVICLAGTFDPVRKMGNVNNRLQAAEASARRIFELVDLPAEQHAERSLPVRKLPEFRETIEFRNLCFAYPSNPSVDVLRDISLMVEKGEVVALVGPNGSGKTTLMALLLRFFDPRSGRILIDGNDLATVSLESLRRQIGLVTQETVVFSDTVRGNIAYGAPDADEEQIQRASRLAHVDEFARELSVRHNGSVTRGYDAWISGRTLSGGQRQRIALARAILRDPPILILDEATSQVDSESERKIQEALDDVMRGRTTFIIAHRFSTIARADRIVVLNEGEVVGQGQHDDLLASCAPYVRLCETQFAHAT